MKKLSMDSERSPFRSDRKLVIEQRRCLRRATPTPLNWLYETEHD
ncbi:MAG: hypothetical protein RMY62_011010 [Nostoc sp. ZfuVER08]|nr:hypothetical protein [Nostoc sp. ZfuVER08]